MAATAPGYDLLAAFAAIAEEGSFSRAARRLGVTKGTVSRAIMRLEDHLATELVHRNTHKVAISTAGTALYERTAPHLAALQRAIATLPERSEQPSGQLRITAPHDVAAIFLPELMAQFLVRYPSVTFDVRVTNAPVDLVAGRFDLAIRGGAGKLADSTLTARRLGLGTAGYYASPTYLARRGEPHAFGDPDHDWVVIPAMLKLLRAPKDFRPRVLVDDIMTVRSLVTEGAGVGLLPRFVTERHVAEGRLAPLKLPHSLTAASLFVVYPSSGQVSRKVAAFRDFIVQRLKARPLLGG